MLNIFLILMKSTFSNLKKKHSKLTMDMYFFYLQTNHISDLLLVV
jgi:hypothetical protein